MSNTQHAPECKRAFANYDQSCPRCRELSSGAPARKGWGWQKKQWEAQQSAAIRAHDCKKSGCGPVCTFGDW